MNKFISVILLVIVQLILGACVELRDPEKREDSQAPALVIAQESLKDLIVDEEMYVYQDQILTMDQIERLTYKTVPDWTPGTQTLKYRRIVFSPQGKLFTLGNNLRLIAEELESDRGEILTFPEGTKAPEGTAGLHGGFITLQIQHPQGQLFVTLRGEHGGDGRPGLDTVYFSSTCWSYTRMSDLNAKPGDPGQRGGDSGSLRLLTENQSLFDLRRRREFGRGGQGGKAGQPGRCSGIENRVGASAPDGKAGADGLILE